MGLVRANPPICMPQREGTIVFVSIHNRTFGAASGGGEHPGQGRASRRRSNGPGSPYSFGGSGVVVISPTVTWTAYASVYCSVSCDRVLRRIELPIGVFLLGFQPLVGGSSLIGKHLVAACPFVS